MDLNPIAAVSNAVSGVINALDKLFTSDEERVRQETLQIKQEMQPHLEVLKNAASQIEINKIEAKHPSIFVAGARPAILWVFVIALFYQFLLYPILQWIWILSQHDSITKATFEYCNPESLERILLQSRGGNLDDAKEFCLSMYVKTMPPSLNMDQLWPLVTGILGLAGWRTIDKVNGVARENMKNTI